ncbi:MAG: hypothetical protein IJG88_00710 [Eggerthellaceae bacterium]|nr:hypothetical protein [Eggerthellaceae bacterium]
MSECRVPAPVPEKPEVWHLSRDGERYGLYDRYPSRDAAVMAGVGMYEEVAYGRRPLNDLYDEELAWASDPRFYVGKEVEWWPSIDEYDIIERAQIEADDFAGEFADGWLDVTDKYELDLLREMMQSAFDEWMKRTGNEPTFFCVECTEVIDPREYGKVGL